MTKERKPPRGDNVIELRIQGKSPGSRGRAGREHPELGDRKTQDALERISSTAAGLDRSKYAEPEAPIELKDRREEAFCIYATSGYSLAAGWRLAFDEPQAKEAEYKARVLIKSPRIMLRINELLEARKASMVDDAERIRALISSRLELEATTAAEGSTRLKALELLGKQPHVAAFEDRKRMITEDSSADDIRKALRERLERLGRSA